VVEIMVHKPKHNVHSFRGLLADGGQDEINLERSNVNLAFRITKFELMSNGPKAADLVGIVKVWREEQTTITSVTIDFSDPDLLAVGLWREGNAMTEPATFQSIFDNILFSRNIYVTNVDADGSGSMNYYLEIEEVPVTASTLMQLKLGVARKLNLQQD